MNVVEIIIGIALLLMAIFLVAAILMQSGKDKRLSGTIAGGAETFFGKTDRGICTIDTVHPNDIGFYRMAEVILPTVKKMLDSIS